MKVGCGSHKQYCLATYAHFFVKQCPVTLNSHSGSGNYGLPCTRIIRMGASLRQFWQWLTYWLYDTMLTVRLPHFIPYEGHIWCETSFVFQTFMKIIHFFNLDSLLCLYKYLSTNNGIQKQEVGTLEKKKLHKNPYTLVSVPCPYNSCLMSNQIHFRKKNKENKISFFIKYICKIATWNGMPWIQGVLIRDT